MTDSIDHAAMNEWQQLVAEGRTIMEDLASIPHVAVQIEALQAIKGAIVQIAVDPASFRTPSPEFVAVDARMLTRTINNSCFIMMDGSLCDRPKRNKFIVVTYDDAPTEWQLKQYRYFLPAIKFVHGLYRQEHPVH